MFKWQFITKQIAGLVFMTRFCDLAPSTADSDYTNISLWLNNGPLPVGTTNIDVQVEAFIGYVHKSNEGYLAGWVFTGESNGWKSQTVTVPSNTPLSVNSPNTTNSIANLITIPLSTLIAIFTIFLTIIVVLALLLFRKHRNPDKVNHSTFSH